MFSFMKVVNISVTNFNRSNCMFHFIYYLLYHLEYRIHSLLNRNGFVDNRCEVQREVREGGMRNGGNELTFIEDLFCAGHYLRHLAEISHLTCVTLLWNGHRLPILQRRKLRSEK